MLSRLSRFRYVCADSSDHVEGEAKIAERNAHFDDDGVIDKHEKKEIEKARKRQLESRGRGPAQIKAYRSGKWMLRVSGYNDKADRRVSRIVSSLAARRENVSCRVTALTFSQDSDRSLDTITVVHIMHDHTRHATLRRG